MLWAHLQHRGRVCLSPFGVEEYGGVLFFRTILIERYARARDPSLYTIEASGAALPSGLSACKLFTKVSHRLVGSLRLSQYSCLAHKSDLRR